jgi:hypothetical protein
MMDWIFAYCNMTTVSNRINGRIRENTKYRGVGLQRFH